MKDAYGGTYLFGIVVLFMLLFTGIMCLTINRSKAYSVKDAIVTVIEENQGIELENGPSISGNDGLDSIEEELKSYNYRTTGTCPEGYQGYSYNGDSTFTSEESSFCLKVVDKTTADADTGETDGELGCYYSVVVFYKLDLPVLKEVFNFSISGETITLYSEYCGVG